MCEVSSRPSFFRPWNGEPSDTGSSEHEDTKKIVRISTMTGNSIVKLEKEAGEIEADESRDSDSVVSSVSSRSNRRRSVSSVSSTNSCDRAQETGSLDLLSNFVLGAQSELQNNAANARQIREKRTSSDSSTSGEVSSGSSSNSPRSAFTPTSYHGLYTNFDYLNQMRVPPLPNIDNPSASTYLPVLPTNLLYGLASMPFGGYGNHMEEAVKLIHQQDVAAKQMKKLRPKKFRCEHCDVAFSNNGQLKGHVRIHTGERPFKCDADGCGKSFTRNEELTRHKRIHTGLRPHSCLLCGKRFGRKDHLKKHTRTHDNRAAYQLPTIGPFGLAHHHTYSPVHSIPSYMY